MELWNYEVGRALNLWYFCATEIIVYLFINLEQQKHSYMLHVSGLHGLIAVLPCMSWPVGTPQERTGLPGTWWCYLVNGLHLLLVTVKRGGRQRFIPFSKCDDSTFSTLYIPYISIVSNYCPWSNFGQIHQWLSAQASTQKWQLLQGGYRQYTVLI